MYVDPTTSSMFECMLLIAFRISCSGFKRERHLVFIATSLLIPVSHKYFDNMYTVWYAASRRNGFHKNLATPNNLLAAPTGVATPSLRTTSQVYNMITLTACILALCRVLESRLTVFIKAFLIISIVTLNVRKRDTCFQLLQNMSKWLDFV